MHAGDVDATTVESVAVNPGPIVVHGDEVWVGDWDVPNLARLPAIGAGQPHRVALPVETHPAGITFVAAGAGALWATVPDDRAVWRIDPRTGQTKRIPMPYYPWGVAVGDDGVWVAVRAHDA
jgi:streptogramin lyase